MWFHRYKFLAGMYLIHTFDSKETMNLTDYSVKTQMMSLQDFPFIFLAVIFSFECF